MATTRTATMGMGTEVILTCLMWFSSRPMAMSPTMAVAGSIYMTNQQHLIRITAGHLTSLGLAIIGIAKCPHTCWLGHEPLPWEPSAEGVWRAGYCPRSEA